MKQAPRAYYTRIHEYLQRCGFKIRKSEVALYYKIQGIDILIACLYVNDLLFMRSTYSMNDGFKKNMKREFKMNDLGLMIYFLGMEVYQPSKEIFLFLYIYIYIYNIE